MNDFQAGQIGGMTKFNAQSKAAEQALAKMPAELRPENRPALNPEWNESRKGSAVLSPAEVILRNAKKQKAA
jgi:hypothetical protein